MFSNTRTYRENILNEYYELLEKKVSREMIEKLVVEIFCDFDENNVSSKLFFK